MPDIQVKVSFPYKMRAPGPIFEFIPFDPPLQNGTATITINSIPTGITAASAWVTERYVPSDTPKIGSAAVQTSSVQLDTNLKLVRVICSTGWNNPVPCGVLLILGLTSGSPDSQGRPISDFEPEIHCFALLALVMQNTAVFSLVWLLKLFHTLLRRRHKNSAAYLIWEMRQSHRMEYHPVGFYQCILISCTDLVTDVATRLG